MGGGGGGGGGGGRGGERGRGGGGGGGGEGGGGGGGGCTPITVADALREPSSVTPMTFSLTFALTPRAVVDA